MQIRVDDHLVCNNHHHFCNFLDFCVCVKQFCWVPTNILTIYCTVYILTMFPAAEHCGYVCSCTDTTCMWVLVEPLCGISADILTIYCTKLSCSRTLWSSIHVLLPIFHAGSHALLAGRRRTLDGQLPEAACHHGDGTELAARAAAGAVGVLLAAEPVVRAPAHGPVVRAHERHLHAGGGCAGGVGDGAEQCSKRIARTLQHPLAQECVRV